MYAVQISLAGGPINEDIESYIDAMLLGFGMVDKTCARARDSMSVIRGAQDMCAAVYKIYRFTDRSADST
ncbi:hypothetical protein FIBSPDRAFT_848878, partial [Athelia psychrophila]